MKNQKKKILLISGLILLILLVLILTLIYFQKRRLDDGVTIKENVKVITGEMDPKYQPSVVDEDSISFKNDPGYKEGDVVVSGITAEAPEGFIRRIVGVEAQQNTVVYETEPAVLTDVFEEAHIVKYFTLEENEVREIEGISRNESSESVANVEPSMSSLHSDQPIECSSLGEGDASKIIKLDTHEKSILFEKVFDEEISDNLRMSGEVDLSCLIEIKLDIEDGEVDFGIVSHANSDGELMLYWGGELFDKDNDEGEFSKVIYEKSLPSCQFFLGEVPVVITNDVQATIEGSVQAEGSIGTGVGLKAECISGFEYSSKEDKINEINERKYLSDGIKWECEARLKGEADAGFYAHLITKLYGSTGADMSIGMAGNVSGEIIAGIDESRETQSYGCLKLSVLPKVRGKIVVTVPVVDTNLTETTIFEMSMKPLWEKTWENSNKSKYLLYNEDGLMLYIAFNKREPRFMEIYGVNRSGNNYEFMVSCEYKNIYLSMSSDYDILKSDKNFSIDVKGFWRTEESMNEEDFHLRLYLHKEGDEGSDWYPFYKDFIFTDDDIESQKLGEGEVETKEGDKLTMVIMESISSMGEKVSNINVKNKDEWDIQKKVYTKRNQAEAMEKITEDDNFRWLLEADEYSSEIHHDVHGWSYFVYEEILGKEADLSECEISYRAYNPKKYASSDFEIIYYLNEKEVKRVTIEPYNAWNDEANLQWKELELFLYDNSTGILEITSRVW